MTARSRRARVRLGGGGEFDLIRSLLAPGTGLPDEVLVGPGDDAAVLEGGPWAVTCDLSVEDVHFRGGWLGDEEVGWRAAASALSDLAAVAARPVAVLLSMALPAGDPAARGRAVAAGVRRAADAVDAAVVGGDLTRSPGPLVLDVVALGVTPRPVLRDGARPGDELWVTGRLGGAGGAVRLWEEGGEPPPALRAAFAHPIPRVREALWLARRAPLHALVDLSDGLAGDAGHLAAASGVAIVLAADRIPLAQGLAEAFPAGAAALELALGGGEDYELCLAVEPGGLDLHRDAFTERFAVPLTRVGRVTEGEGVHVEGGANGSVPRVTGGFSHFGPGGGT